MSKQKKIIQQPKVLECKPSYTSLLLADAIFVFHCIIILFVLLAPFSNIPAILILHITFAICLLVHWHANSNVCSLSILEAHLRGLDSREDTFTHQFVAPMYDISATTWSNMVWSITIIVLCISVYKLYNTEKFKTAWKCYSDMEPKEAFSDKLVQFMLCFKPLFLME
jgi:hypothetical protein